MDLDFTLLLVTAIWCGAALFSALRARPLATSQLAAVGVVGISVLVAWTVSVSWAARVGFALTLLGVLAPAWLLAYGTRLVVAQEYRRARRAFALASLLRPSPRLLQYRTLLRALELAHADRLVESELLLDSFAPTSPLHAQARSLRFRLRADWRGLLAWAERERERQPALIDAELGSSLVRAHGEVGALADMVDVFAALTRAPGLAPRVLAELRLMAHAFSGHVESVALLLDGPFARMAHDTRAFWLATAELAHGSERARLKLEVLAARASALNRASFEHRLRSPLAPPSALDPGRRALLERDRAALARDARYARGGLERRSPAWATRGLVAINCAVFALELVSGGSTDEETLWRLGSLIVPLPGPGEAWRLFTANFLHYGWLHVLLNMAGLLLLGPFVERNLGSARFLFVYLVSGVCAMAGALGFAHRDSLVLGASGSVMAVMGAQLVIALFGLRRAAPLARRHLIGLCAAVALQTLIDLITPQISLSAHWFGLLAGISLTALSSWRVLAAVEPEEARA